MLKKLRSFLPKIILFFLTITAIFFQYNQIPKNINYDEVDFAKLALSLNDKTYTPYTAFATGHTTLYFYIILFSFKLFGISNFALRFPAAVFGLLNVFILFFILKSVFSKQKHLSFFLSVFFLTSRWYLNFTRFSFEATFLLFLELTSIYFLFQSVKTSKWKHIMLSAIFAGLAFNSYLPGRIFFLLPLIFLFSKKIKLDGLKKFFLFIIPFIIIIFPLTIHLTTHKDIRFSQQSFFQNKKLKLSKKTEYLLKNIKSTAFMFGLKGDMNGRHNYPGKPALNPILGLFFALGLIICLKNTKSFYNLFFLLYFFISLVPTLFTNPVENPNMLRTFAVIPSVIYFVGVSLSTIISKYKTAFVNLIIFLLVVFSSLYELRTYFSFQNRVFKNSFEIKCTVDKLVDKNKPYPKECLVSHNEF